MLLNSPLRRLALVAVPFVLAFGPACERKGEAGRKAGFFAFADAPETRPDPVVKERPQLGKQAFYKVSIQGVPVGTAVVGRDDATSIPLGIEMRLVHRLGGSLVTSRHVVEAKAAPHQDGEAGRAGETEITTTSEFLQGKDELRSEKNGFAIVGGLLRRSLPPANETARLLALAPAPGVGADPSTGDVAGSQGTAAEPVPFTHWAFFKAPEAAGANAKGTNPFTGAQVARDPGDTYDTEGTLVSGHLLWHGGLTLEFTRAEESDLRAYSDEILRTPVELSLFSTPATLAQDVRRLQADAESCTTFARDAENQVRREFPQLPYLMHRRIYNFGLLCTRLGRILVRPEARANLAKALDDVHWVFRIVLEEDKAELPVELLSHPDAAVLSDATRRWQWARAAGTLLRETHGELSAVIALERAQKVNLAMRVQIDRLTPGSVVKGFLRAKDTRFKTEVRTAEGNKAKATSWMRLPEAIVKPLRLASTARASVPLDQANTPGSVSFELLHGQAYARGEATPLSAVCESFGGKVGLDLGDAPNTILGGALARGVWDEGLRLSLVRDFAKRAGSHPACRQVIFSVPKALVARVKTELDSFEKNVLQSESEFQISNRNVRRMRVQPGTYELVLTSLVSGEVIGTRDIIVPEGKPSLAVNVRF